MHDLEIQLKTKKKFISYLEKFVHLMNFQFSLYKQNDFYILHLLLELYQPNDCLFFLTLNLC